MCHRENTKWHMTNMFYFVLPSVTPFTSHANWPLIIFYVQNWMKMWLYMSHFQVRTRIFQWHVVATGNYKHLKMYHLIFKGFPLDIKLPTFILIYMEIYKLKLTVYICHASMHTVYMHVWTQANVGLRVHVEHGPLHHHVFPQWKSLEAEVDRTSAFHHTAVPCGIKHSKRFHTFVSIRLVHLNVEPPERLKWQLWQVLFTVAG